MKNFLAYMVVTTIVTFLIVGLIFLLFAQVNQWFYLAIASLANGVVMGLVLKKI